MTRSLRFILLVVAGSVLAAVPAAGQASRSALIDEARATFDEAAVIRLLHSAMDPALGEPDSLWAVAGYELGQALIDTGQPERAALWLRVVARHTPQYPVDRTLFTDEVVAAYNRALQSVLAANDEGAASTSWRWVESLDPEREGTIQISGTADEFAITIESVGPIQPGAVMSLPPDTYTITAGAEDWESVRITRDVLPGTGLLIELDMVPLLPPGIEAEAARNVVQINWQQAGRQICRTGYVASADGLVLTTMDAVRDGGAISVAVGGSQTFTNVPVVQTDTTNNLAVLRLPVESTTQMAVSDQVLAGGYAWSIQAPGCPDGAASRSRLESGTRSTALTLGASLPAAAAGSPLVDRDGFLIGIVTGPSSALPDMLTRDVIQRARALIAVQVTPRSGGFPWKWVGIGSATAGAVVALLTRGPNETSTTGRIVITLPG